MPGEAGVTTFRKTQQRLYGWDPQSRYSLNITGLFCPPGLNVCFLPMHTTLVELVKLIEVMW